MADKGTQASLSTTQQLLSEMSSKMTDVMDGQKDLKRLVRRNEKHLQQLMEMPNSAGTLSKKTVRYRGWKYFLLSILSSFQELLKFDCFCVDCKMKYDFDILWEVQLNFYVKFKTHYSV